MSCWRIVSTVYKNHNITWICFTDFLYSGYKITENIKVLNMLLERKCIFGKLVKNHLEKKIKCQLLTPNMNIFITPLWSISYNRERRVLMTGNSRPLRDPFVIWHIWGWYPRLSSGPHVCAYVLICRITQKSDLNISDIKSSFVKQWL